MIQIFQYVEVAVVARNKLLTTFIRVQTEDPGFKYNQGNQWNSSSGSHCSRYPFSKKPLGFWGRKFQGVRIGSLCYLQHHGWKKKRILSLPRDWAGGRFLFSFTRCFIGRKLAEQGGLVHYCCLSTRHGQNRAPFTWKWQWRPHSALWDGHCLHTPPMWKKDDVSEWSPWSQTPALLVAPGHRAIILS